jgi:hypothetical protein
MPGIQCLVAESRRDDSVEEKWNAQNISVEINFKHEKESLPKVYKKSQAYTILTRYLVMNYFNYFFNQCIIRRKNHPLCDLKKLIIKSSKYLFPIKYNLEQ